MEIPIQSKPIIRNQVTLVCLSTHSITPSDKCGCPNKCLGVCVDGECLGPCA